jgi:hypothetical protein
LKPYVPACRYDEKSNKGAEEKKIIHLGGEEQV